MSKALLYATEFTMPDGTTRPPLVDRLPEIRPRMADGSELRHTVIDGNKRMYAWECESSPSDYYSIDSQSAAASSGVSVRTGLTLNTA